MLRLTDSPPDSLWFANIEANPSTRPQCMLPGCCIHRRETSSLHSHDLWGEHQDDPVATEPGHVPRKQKYIRVFESETVVKGVAIQTLAIIHND